MTSDLPLYEQLKQRVIEGIAKGDLSAGEVLPSVRALAADLGVNMHTVAKAYAQLKDMGFVSVHRSRGAVVNPLSVFAANPEYLDALTDQLRSYAIEAMCRGVKAGEWLGVCNDAYEGLHKKRSF
jgi:GntR family transcriptional regulator